MNPLALAWLDDHRLDFPPLEEALREDSGVPGLLAAGGDLSVPRLRAAYRHGAFPWFSEGQPILWWSPDPRMVLPVAELKVSRSLRRTLQRFADDPRCALRIDSSFRQVIGACAATPRPGQDGTWIVQDMVDAYTAWHAQGDVHSFETWMEGELVGGLYGVCLGRMFFGESMFSHRADASKIALAGLVAFCRARGIELIDCQQRTAHLASLGAREIPRSEFIRHVRRAVQEDAIRDWRFEPSLWQELPALSADGKDRPASSTSSVPGIATSARPPHPEGRGKA